MTYPEPKQPDYIGMWLALVFVWVLVIAGTVLL